MHVRECLAANEKALEQHKKDDKNHKKISSAQETNRRK